MRNSSSLHQGGFRHFKSGSKHRLTIDTIQGPVDILALDSDITLTQSSGSVDIFNEFGTTSMELCTITDQPAVLIRSHAGRVILRGARDTYAKNGVEVFTTCGDIRIEELDEIVDKVSIGTNVGSYSGFWPKPKDQDERIYRLANFGHTITTLWEGRKAPEKPTIINRAGDTSILLKR